MAATFLYDGDCAFCSTCARFVSRRIPTPARVEAWQFSDLDALGVTEEACESAVQWIPGDGTAPTAGPVAISRLLRSTRGASAVLWRPAGRILGLRPVTALAWPVYRWVARNRHRMPGGTAACSVPQATRDKWAAMGNPPTS